MTMEHIHAIDRKYIFMFIYFPAGYVSLSECTCSSSVQFQYTRQDLIFLICISFAFKNDGSKVAVESDWSSLVRGISEIVSSSTASWSTALHFDNGEIATTNSPCMISRFMRSSLVGARSFGRRNLGTRSAELATDASTNSNSSR